MVVLIDQFMAPQCLVSSAAPLVATVSLLNGNRPVASARLQQRLEREGRVTLMEGVPWRVERVARALARRGYTPSLNLRPGC
jgi:elongation factor P hydroxylase